MNVPLGLVKAVLRGEMREKLRGRIADAKPDHLWLRATDGGMPRHAGLPRGAQRMLSQLRAGRCTVSPSG